jgi:2-hydroxychromene-2-carboxylate isomerase
MPPTTPRTIRFYFDYISHNAYLAWIQLPQLARKYGFTVEPIPVLFAGLLGAHGQRGPAEIPAKAFWMGKNLLRKAALLGVPLNPPAFHPFNPLLALRASSLPLDAAARHTLIDALFQAVWVHGQHVSEPAVVERVATACGLDGAALLAAATGADAKDRLRRQTDTAIANLVFGVPSMAVGDEVFWGYDDFPHLELFLAGKDPLDIAQWQNWLDLVRPSAMRKEVLSGGGEG